MIEESGKEAETSIDDGVVMMRLNAVGWFMSS